MNNLEKNDFFRLSKIRFRNLKFRKGRVIAFSVLAAIFVILDLVAIDFVINNGYGGVEKPGTNGILPIAGDAFDVFIITIINSVLFMAIWVFMFTSIFAGDKSSNQTSLELRTGYDRRDIYATKIFEGIIAFLSLFIIVLIINGATYGSWKNSVMAQVWDQNAGGYPQTMKVACRNAAAMVYLNAIWWYLIAFIVAAIVTIGLSFVSNSGGTATGGAIISLVIVVVIILASVGVFQMGEPNSQPVWWASQILAG